MSSSTLEDRPEMPSDTDTYWVRSSLSFPNSYCVEVAGLPDGWVGMRDSKDPSGPVLRFPRDEWRAFLRGARNGEFDHFGR